MAPDLVPVTRRLNVKSGPGKVMGVVRENYLRNDLSCRSALCFEETCSTLNATIKGSFLSKDVTHYLVPMVDVAKNYFDTLEFSELTGIIFLQTVVNAVQLSSWRQYRKLCNLIRDLNRGSIFFANEFFQPTYCPRDQNSETTQAWQMRTCYKAICWYYEHLGGQKPFVIVTQNEDFIAKFRHNRLEIFIMTMGEYLQQFWPNLTTVHLVYESLLAVHSEKPETETKPRKEQIFEDHLRPEVLEAGLKNGSLVQGRIYVNKHHPGLEAFVTRTNSLKVGLGSSDNEDILIPGRLLRNRSVDGDLVVVQLLPKSEWKSKINRLATEDEDKGDEEEWERRADVLPTGKVVGILQRNTGDVVAAIQKDSVGEIGGGKRILVCPYDRRIPKIRIMTSQAPQLLQNRIVVRIDNWPANSQYPNGHFVRTLGKMGDLEAEIKVLLVQHDIDERIGPFSQGVLAEMPHESWTPDPDEVSQRKDFRETHLIMSIDPKGCEDVDDTISVRKMKNGNIELGVFIADVSFFVKPNSLSDVEAQRRATTVYLADRRYDMLPGVLSANICSLLSGVDRYAMSVIWELEPETCKVLGVWYGRSVIRSSYKLSYEVAQDILDGKSETEMKNEIPELILTSGEALTKKFAKLKESLQLLSRVAKTIQDQREREGALRLESTEVTFEFQRSSLEDIKPKEHLAVHETVAECMIFANQWVAKKISKSFPDRSLLRRHPPPKMENFESLKVCASSRNWRVETWSNKALAESLDKCNDTKDPYVNFLLRGLATHAMVQAVYFSTGSVPREEWEHYGLALQLYTHFTSPIRRYADIIVHRLLMAALKNQDWWNNSGKADDLPSNTELHKLSDHINERNRSAQIAQRESQILFQTLYFKGKSLDDPRCIAEGVIFSLRANGFLIYIPRYGLKGPVYLQDSQKRDVLWCSQISGPKWLSGGVIRQAEFEIQVETLEGTQSYRLFDHVTVAIQLKQSGDDLHSNGLAYHLLAKRRSSNQDEIRMDKGEINFLHELQRIQESKKSEIDQEESANDKTAKKDPKKKSAYDFFIEMKQLGISTQK